MLYNKLSRDFVRFLSEESRLLAVIQVVLAENQKLIKALQYDSRLTGKRTSYEHTILETLLVEKFLLEGVPMRLVGEILRNVFA